VHWVCGGVVNGRKYLRLEYFFSISFQALTPAMKISDVPFLSWSQDPAWDDFPHNFRFHTEDQVFTFNYSIYDSWGGTSWSYLGTYTDDGEILTLNFTHRCSDGELHPLTKPFTHMTSYTFVGNQVELAVCAISSFLRGAEKAPTRYYWKDFVVHTPIQSDSDSD
jgi:hypothetical protein